MAMSLEQVIAVLKTGMVFSIETSKTVAFEHPKAPAPMMLKVALYCVTAPVEPRPSQVGTWWMNTEHDSIIQKKGRGTRFYLLCAIPVKSPIMGSSAFYPLNMDTGEFNMLKPYSKAAVAVYLPPQEPFKADYLTLPIDSIESLEALTTV